MSTLADLRRTVAAAEHAASRCDGVGLALHTRALVEQHDALTATDLTAPQLEALRAQLTRLRDLCRFMGGTLQRALAGPDAGYAEHGEPAPGAARHHMDRVG